MAPVTMAILHDISEEIDRLRKEKNAVILAHNYQIPEIQDLADYTGDSLGLSQKASETDAEIIIFCGVHFMAETASIISPDKKVLIPDPEAGCSLAETINLEQVRKWKSEHPDALVVSYVNTSAAVKSETDYCVTSSNAVKIVESIPKDREILFLPDMFLGAFVSKVTGRKIYIWPGECHVHAGIRPGDIRKIKESYPNAEMIVHPECGCTTSFLHSTAGDDELAKDIKFFSTGKMIDYTRNSDTSEFVVATETGILHTLRKQSPEKKFYPAKADAICEYMKMITVDKVLNSLREEVYEVKVPEDIARKAKKSIDRMLYISAQ